MSQTKRRAVVHIGTPKTGTTAIQGFLIQHRDQLHERGFHYAVSPGRRNHVALAAYGAGEGKSANVVRRAGGAASGGARTIGLRLERDMAAEFGSLPSAVHTVLFSSEQMTLHLSDVDAVRRLKVLLERFFDPVTVVVYLRRQDEFAVSKYSTALRAGETTPDILPALGQEGSLYRLADVVERWATVFGAPALVPRVFERSQLVGGDVIADYLAVAGIEGLNQDAAKVPRNPALSAETQELIRRLNVLATDRQVEDRPQIGLYLRTPAFHGMPRSPSRAEALAFFDRFRADNERIRAAFFPDRASLFTEDFSRYPDRPSEVGQFLPDDSAVLGAALEALLLLMDELRQSQVATLVERAREAIRTDRPTDARREWTAVTRLEKGHREALRALAALDAAEGVAQPAAAEPHEPTPAAPGKQLARAARRAERRAARQPASSAA